MPLFLSAEDVQTLATPELVLGAARAAVLAEREGRAVIPPRLDLNLPLGFLRVMPGAVGELMGLKVMTVVRGVGNRYLLLVYSQESGALLALLDAAEVTRLRTAGMTAVAAEILQPVVPEQLALIGSGFEATTHLHTIARLWPLQEVTVYSPSQEHREAFAARESAALGLSVRAVGSCREALASASTVVLATKATEPVIDAEHVLPGSVVLSIGSTRPDLRELDRATLARAALVVVDDAASVMRESGDIIDALEHMALTAEHLVSIGAAADSPRTRERPDGRDLGVFKSVGTAIQDLSLAGDLVAAAARQGLGRELGELAELKRAAAAAAVGGEAA